MIEARGLVKHDRSTIAVDNLSALAAGAWALARRDV
jgi:hypothetical protein